MILLKRLNGTQFNLNAELIEQIESTPDTVITLTTGNNIVVLDKREDVIEKIVEYRRKVNLDESSFLNVSTCPQVGRRVGNPNCQK
ncbi:MAG: flagellar FlbD family protein [Elusimicrobiota bacterium]